MAVPEEAHQTLRDLERDGLVRRTVYPTVPQRVEYAITPLGTDLGRISHAMGAWVVRHQHEITAAGAEFDAVQAIGPVPLPGPGRRGRTGIDVGSISLGHDLREHKTTLRWTRRPLSLR
ncbi:winged helix-turn-helix transcriptional regulator [Nocardia asteroides]|uniref:winged helix-turn-helix transcriptional regulator n=1 Tax=Nocardia asteroides TaxID=1824 RepID=UPI003F544B53